MKNSNQHTYRVGKAPLPHELSPGRKNSSGFFDWNRNDLWNTTVATVFPSLGACLRTTAAMTLALYLLNQQHLLPRPLSGAVSKILFWPTLPITLSRRLGRWVSVVDETVVMGGAPLAVAGFPETLYEDYGVRGVVNLCEEYPGPNRSYKKLGMRHLWLPTTDHFEPTVEALEDAVSFIAAHEALGKKVYVHCRAGHGRSAAVVFAWLLSKNPCVDLQELNRELCAIRSVRKTLWKQQNILEFRARLQGESVSEANAGTAAEREEL